MSEYGLTPQGPNIKRLDVILDEMHEQLSKAWGVNTKQNPQSFINHLLTNLADRLAELWEFGEDVYYSQYPSTAEGVSLDNAAQYGGSLRETGAKSYYPMHCTGVDGTKLAAGTTIASNTNPKTYLSLVEEKEITRNSFNKAQIKVVSASSGSLYTVMLDGNPYPYTSQSSDPLSILKGLQSAITDDAFDVEVDETNCLLTVSSQTKDTSHALVLSENLTTETVTSVITFGTTETGDILLPDGAITEIVKADAGLLAVTNPCGYVAGNDAETDTEFRKSYSDKIFNRSSMMQESIRSAILANVQGVNSVATYENDTDYVTFTYTMTGNEGARNGYYAFKCGALWYTFKMPSNPTKGRKLVFDAKTKHIYQTNTGSEDEVPIYDVSIEQPGDVEDITDQMESGIYPHAIEIVVDGGDNTQIAQQILENKAGGINTFGSVEVTLPGVNEEDIKIRFTRPEKVYVWFKLTITFKHGASVPANYVELMKDAILSNIEALDAGQDVVPQEFMSDLYRACSDISYIDISIASTTDSGEVPKSYPDRSVDITARQRAYSDAGKIEVSIDG